MSDFFLAHFADGVLTVSMAPPVAIGGMDLRFTLTKRFESAAPLVQKSMASGFYGVSGMNITNSGQGVFQVQLFGSEMSGQDPGAFAWTVQRLTSGVRTLVADGYLVLLPGQGVTSG